MNPNDSLLDPQEAALIGAASCSIPTISPDHLLPTRAQLHAWERVIAPIEAALRQILAAPTLSSADRRRGEEILAEAEQQLAIVRALLERGLHE